MPEEILIRQAAPTLAGIKTGSLFPCPCDDKEELLADIRQLNRLLVPKGLCLLPIRFLEGQALLYLYRPQDLCRDLQDEQALEILRRAGYGSTSHSGRCVANLIRRFRPPRLRFQVRGAVEGVRRRKEGARAVRAIQKMHGDLLRTLSGGLGHRAACRGSVINFSNRKGH